jgi:hypothetical protein
MARKKFSAKSAPELAAISLGGQDSLFPSRKTGFAIATNPIDCHF